MSANANGTGSTEQLVRAAAAGDRDAAEKLIQRYATVVWATVRRFRLRETDAQDAVQNTWLRMVEHIGELRDSDRLAGWLATTARRECLMILRKSRREVIGMEADIMDRAEDPPEGPERLALNRVMSSLLWKYMAELPACAQDLLMILTRPDAPSYADVSRATGMPIGSIGPRRMRYLHTLRQRLEQAGLDAHTWR
jgi:RNA polymerase sigma factor (sigma-70 family)